MNTDNKYIYYREDRDTYTVKLPIGKGKSITRTTSSLNKAIKIRDALLTSWSKAPQVLQDVYSNQRVQEILDQYIGDAMPAWYDKKRKPYMAMNTNRTNFGIIKTLNKYIGCVKVKELNTDAVQSLAIALCDHMGVKAAGNYIGQLKLFYADLGIMQPCVGIKYPKQAPPEKKESFSEDEQKRILVYTKQEKEYHYFFIFYLYFVTGCRCGEIIGLSWEDIDFEMNTIHIHNIVVKDIDSGKYILQPYAKTHTSNRRIPLTDKAIFTLKILQKMGNKRGIIFHRKDGSPLVPQTVSTMFKKVLVSLDIRKNVSLHSTRHTMATRLIKNNVSIPTVMKLGGWSSSSTLLDRYAQSSLDEVRDAVDILTGKKR